MKEYNNIKELEKDYPDLAIKVKEHFKDKSLNFPLSAIGLIMKYIMDIYLIL